MSEPGVGRARGRARGRTKEPEPPTLLRPGESPSGVSPGLPVTPDPSVPGLPAIVSIFVIKNEQSNYVYKIVGFIWCQSFTKANGSNS